MDFPLIPWRVEVLKTDCTDNTDNSLMIMGIVVSVKFVFVSYYIFRSRGESASTLGTDVP